MHYLDRRIKVINDDAVLFTECVSQCLTSFGFKINIHIYGISGTTPIQIEKRNSPDEIVLMLHIVSRNN